MAAGLGSGLRGLMLGLVMMTTRSAQQLDELARHNSLQEDAPIKASSEITINASREKIWTLLTRVEDWPRWQPGITHAELAEGSAGGAMVRGTQFNWSKGALAIHSRVALLQPQEAFGWTGTAMGAEGIHLWRLDRLPTGATRVRTSESMDGALIVLFFSSEKLAAEQRNWLGALKREAER